MTSLMDVMFLVLVFFIYCIFDMSVHRGLKVDLPNASGTIEKGDRIVVTIAGDDSIQVNGVQMPLDDAVLDVGKRWSTGKGMPVLISGDRGSTLGTGIELLERLKQAGVEKVSFQVKGRRQ